MSQNLPILKWFLLLLCLLLILATGYLFFLSLNPNLNITNLEEEPDRMKSDNLFKDNQISVKESFVNKKIKKNVTISDLKNPFIRPQLIKKNTSRLPRIQYQGIIETNNIKYGLLHVGTNNKTYMVQEGQYIPELRLEVKKITSVALTFHKDGNDVVISLGGIKK